MHNNKIKILIILSLLFSSTFCEAKTNGLSKHPFYIGVIGGYGSTTWKGLVPAKEHQNAALMLSTPIKANEGGATWGFLTGYEFTSFFAIEASYMKFADSNVEFDPMSLFSFYHEGLEVLNTKTETLSLMGKLMVPIPHSKMKIFSSVGVAGVHRHDIVVNNWHTGPSFGAGINYNLAEHLMGEIAGNFTTGYGQSQLSPVDSYFPFLYSVAVHLIYRI